MQAIKTVKLLRIIEVEDFMIGSATELKLNHRQSRLVRPTSQRECKHLLAPALLELSSNDCFPLAKCLS